MTTTNLLWPRWATLVAHLPVKQVGSWKTIQKAAALLANRYGRAQDARFARLAWEELEAARKTAARELWARPPHRLRSVRHFFALALALGLSSSTPSWGATPGNEDEAERRAAAGTTEELELDQVELEEPGRLYRALGWAMFPAATGDLASTEYALAEGGAELNPLMQNRGVRVAGTVAFPFAMNYLSEELRKDGHPKLALWMRIAVVGLKGYAIVHNLRAAR